jgi:hypothetical protein
MSKKWRKLNGDELLSDGDRYIRGDGTIAEVRSNWFGSTVSSLVDGIDGVYVERPIQSEWTEWNSVDEGMPECFHQCRIKGTANLFDGELVDINITHWKARKDSL